MRLITRAWERVTGDAAVHWMVIVGRSVWGPLCVEAPVEGGEGRGSTRGVIEDLDSTLAGGRPILRVRDNAVESS